MLAPRDLPGLTRLEIVMLKEFSRQMKASAYHVARWPTAQPFI
jgi:hypothetical protein